MKISNVHVGELARNDRGAFKIGPFGSSLKKSELVPSGIPVAGIENVLPNHFKKGFRRFVTLKKFNELSDYEIQPGDVLVTTMGTIGRAAVAPLDIGRTIIDSHLFRMRVDTSRVYPPFLCYALNSQLVISQLKRMARGAIMEGLNTGILKECLIPLPELPEQNRTVAILKEADRLRRTRRDACQLSDTFLQSVFLEMFGEPVRNPRGWDMSSLGDVVTELYRYPTYYDITYVDSGVPEIRGELIAEDGQIAHSCKNLRFISVATSQRFPRTILEAGDIVMSVRGTIGKIGLVPKSLQGANITANLIRIALDRDQVDPIFLWHLLKSDALQAALLRVSASTTILTVKALDLKGLSVIVPPLPLQQKFAAIVRRFERLRAQQREAERQAEHLFQTLLHRAFRGEV